jgi:mono/diheme cytochrome c family protein
MILRILAAACLLVPVVAQDKPAASIWDGIYTADQASRGESGYRQSCASCHGAKLQGGGQNPPLAGSEFTTNWNGRMLSELFDKMQDSMPADKPGQLSRSQNADILAYVLRSNQFPTGPRELAPDAIHDVRFDAAKPGK